MDLGISQVVYNFEKLSFLKCSIVSKENILVHGLDVSQCPLSMFSILRSQNVDRNELHSVERKDREIMKKSFQKFHELK